MEITEDADQGPAKEQEVRPSRISLHMIVKRHLPPESSKWSQAKIIESLNTITHLRLDRENIGEIDGLELLGSSVTNVYFQQNRIKHIDNLDCLPNLRFLALTGNKIRRVENLMHLSKLAFLDLSDNLIEDVDVDELPQTLVLLTFRGNSCTQKTGYRKKLIQDLPKLRQLDGSEISIQEKRDMGYVISSDEEEDETDETDEEIGSGDNNITDGSIKDIFKSLTSDILLRSQSRLEEVLREHKFHANQLEEIRSSSTIPDSARMLSSRQSDLAGAGPPSERSTSSRSSLSGSRLGSRGSPLPPIQGDHAT